MRWIELKLTVSDSTLENISAYIFAMGCEGMNVTDEAVIMYFSQHKWSEEIKSAIVQYIQYFEPLFTSRNLKTKSVADKDWNKIWQEGFKKIRLTNRFIIKPSWDNYEGVPGEIVITINPKMAFGTGHHESTQLIIESMELFVKPGMNIFDVGTGSAILAIVAEKLGAAKIIAIDNDPVAIKNAQENILLNNCLNTHLFISEPELLDHEEFDLVLANINRNVLIQYAPLFPLFMKLNAKIIISGVLLSDENTMVATFRQNGFKLEKKSGKKDWLLLVFQLEKKP